MVNIHQPYRLGLYWMLPRYFYDGLGHIPTVLITVLYATVLQHLVPSGSSKSTAFNKRLNT
jgi:hypothetical protein